MSREKRRRSSRPGWQEEIASERIEILFGLAEEEFEEHPKRSDRYVELARKIGMRYNVRIPKKYRMRFCSSCGNYLVPGKNCTVRTNSRTLSVETTCRNCGHVMRNPYAKEKHKTE